MIAIAAWTEAKLWFAPLLAMVTGLSPSGISEAGLFDQAEGKFTART